MESADTKPVHAEPEFRHCPVCGGELRWVCLKPQEPSRRVCARCGYVFYLDPKVVGCTIVESGGKIVLLRRSIQPEKGRWVIPGGYVDRGEDVRAAAVRETAEECGLSIRIEGLLGVYSYPGYIPVVIVFLAKCLSGQLIARDETAEAGWFLKEEIPWAGLAFRSTADALRDYCRNAERIIREV